MLVKSHLLSSHISRVSLKLELTIPTCFCFQFKNVNNNGSVLPSTNINMMFEQ